MSPCSPVAMLTVALVLSTEPRVPVQNKPLRDDPLVLAAVLEHTILPAHRRRYNAATGAPLALVSETSPMCPARSVGQSSCLIPDQWHGFIDPDQKAKWPGLVADDQARRELVGSLEARNREPHPLPLSAFPGVVLLSPSQTSPADAFEGHIGREVPSASLSLPGYAEPGYAIVYGSYTCGGLCGHGWLFVLSNVSGQWRVTSATVTVVS
jgi:hypothetical protein